jgi:hypothetical protein
MAEQHLLRQDQTRSVKAEQIVVAHPLLVDTVYLKKSNFGYFDLATAMAMAEEFFL